ncbi:MerR family transcriptional regulator [Streptomyces sp. SID14478]|uniref:MerR family transcriptional regulator n=1 Tax=Streptomyces sp. SID14478 TaxID=2706073 RepID=UPI0013DC3202|nr:MerR family transcriptional regulator [Streptomyces sp. SID14478]NEB78168.1 MerR family transcriptional regulator [Streptomyces sp. SID14478]
MKIGELAQISGSSPRQIRHYEAAGLLCSIRLPNGYREFQDSDARRVRNIRTLLDYGLTLGEITSTVRAVCDAETYEALDESEYTQAVGALDGRIALLQELHDRTARQLEALRALRDGFDDAGE